MASAATASPCHLQVDLRTRQTEGSYLTLENYAVVLAATADSGLREADRVSPAAVLLDYRLPDHTGLECLRALRERNLCPSPAVTIFTADFNAYDHEEEVHALRAIITSRLCALEDVRQLVEYLCGVRESELRDSR